MDLLARLAAVVGEKSVLADPGETFPYMEEPRGLFHGRALAVVRPSTVAQISRVLALCNESGTGVVPKAAIPASSAAKRLMTRGGRSCCR